MLHTNPQSAVYNLSRNDLEARILAARHARDAALAALIVRGFVALRAAVTTLGRRAASALHTRGNHPHHA